MATKVCNTCDEIKPESEYYGTSRKCKPCTLFRQKQLKEAKANGTPAAPEKTKRNGKTTSKAPPQAVSAALTMPAGLGLSASIGEDNDIVLEQSTGAGTATIWMSRYEAQQLAIYIAGLPDAA